MTANVALSSQRNAGRFGGLQTIGGASEEHDGFSFAIRRAGSVAISRLTLESRYSMRSRPTRPVFGFCSTSAPERIRSSPPCRYLDSIWVKSALLAMKSEFQSSQGHSDHHTSKATPLRRRQASPYPRTGTHAIANGRKPIGTST